MTTYDKPWFEYVKGFIDKSKWCTMEFYAQKLSGGYEVPKIVDGTDLISRAREHFHNNDYKASAVYARSAFEKILKKHCIETNKKVRYKKKRKYYTSEDFWCEVQGDVNQQTITAVESYRSLILNKLSHYDFENNPLRSELNGAIETIESLRDELRDLRSYSQNN